jgi:hypothetical protein
MKGFAIFFGILLLAAGAGGFVPQLTPDGLLLGIFAVDTMHNVVHVITGILAIAMGVAGVAQARMFFRLIGVVYAVIAVLGFVGGRDGHVMGMAMNMADHLLHVGIAILGLALGFAFDLRPTPPDQRRGPDLRGNV